MKAYNDYLEEVEEIVFNLVNDTDVQAMNARIEAYQRENQELIQRNLDKEVLFKRWATCGELMWILLERRRSVC